MLVMMIAFSVMTRKELSKSEITITILDIHHLAIYLNIRHFGDWILSPSSGGTYSEGPSRKS
jgi:hypothetical protein